MANDLFLGTCIHFGDIGASGRDNPDYELMRASGIDWTRIDVPFPFAGKMGQVSERYRAAVESIRALRQEGIRTLGITPYPLNWPVEDGGEPGSTRFLAAYRQACAFMAKDLADLVDTWQICNEMNLAWFRRPFPMEEECIPFLVYGGLGIRDGNPQARIGVNMATGHEASADRLYRALYPTASVAWDFVGVDAYYGTWECGGPERWQAVLDHVHALCRCDIIVMEYGYTSAGGCMTESERGPQEASSQLLHTVSKWPYGWGDGHTLEEQARYCSICLDIFQRHPAVHGAFWYKWNDGRPCGCGNPGCPENRAYGLVTIDQRPKPAYLAHAGFASVRRVALAAAS